MQVQPGDTAWVQRGPFVGFQGQVVKLNLDGTALVKLDIFGRSTPAEFDPGQLGSSPPDSGISGVREPRRPLSPADSEAVAAPLPEEE
jgi:hypothetical protein